MRRDPAAATRTVQSMLLRIPPQDTLIALAAAKRSTTADDERIARLDSLAKQNRRQGLPTDELLALIEECKATRQISLDRRTRVLKAVVERQISTG